MHRFDNQDASRAVCSMCDTPKPSGGATAANPPGAPTSATAASVDVSDCDGDMRTWMAAFYSPSDDTVRQALNEFLVWLQRNRSRRADTVKGSGGVHIMHALKRYSRSGPTRNLLIALRLAAEAALSDTAERVLFSLGGLEEAIAICCDAPRLGSDIRAHAARFFFNFTATADPRQAYFPKGAARLFETVLLHSVPDSRWASSPSSGNEHNIVLSLSKALTNLSCTEASRRCLVAWPQLFAVWRRVATHPSEEVRKRAAGVASQLIRSQHKHIVLVRHRCVCVAVLVAVPVPVPVAAPVAVADDHTCVFDSQDTEGWVHEITAGKLSRDTFGKAATLKSEFAAATMTLTAADRDNLGECSRRLVIPRQRRVPHPLTCRGTGVNPPPDTSDCPAIFRDSMAKYYSEDPNVVRTALEQTLSDLKADPSRRMQVGLHTHRAVAAACDDMGAASPCADGVATMCTPRDVRGQPLCAREPHHAEGRDPGPG